MLWWTTVDPENQNRSPNRKKSTRPEKPNLAMLCGGGGDGTDRQTDRADVQVSLVTHLSFHFLLTYNHTAS
jgi:hypothetical protein